MNQSLTPPTRLEARKLLGQYARVWMLTLVIVSLEIIGFLLSGSLALLADLGHVLTDTFITFIPLLVLQTVGMKVMYRYALGLGAFVIAFLLLLVGRHIILEAWDAYHGHKHHVHGMSMLFFTALAGIVNIAQFRILSKVELRHKDAMYLGLRFHVVIDTVKNFLLPILALCIVFEFLPHEADLIAAMVIGVVVMLRAVLLLVQSWSGLLASRLV